MRLLQLHTDFIEYEAIEKEVPVAEELDVKKLRLDEVVVIFASVEEGDDESIARKAIDEVKASMDRLGVNKLLIYPYSHLSDKLAPLNTALNIVKVMENYAKGLGLEVYRAPFGWTKAFNIKVKGHPLAEQLKVITTGKTVEEEVPQALRLEEELVSEWYIIKPDGELIPIKDFDFSKYARLEQFAKYEMEKVRAVRQIPPHVTLMKRLELADYEPGSDPGNLRFYPKGRLMKSLIEQYVTQMVREYGAFEVETPIMYDMAHPSLADYLNRFPARQYVIRSEDKNLFLRFSACFGQFLMVKDATFSYKQLPLRIYELTRYSFRREKSGELVGLRRLRAFTMPDCHAFCADLDQAKEELINRFKLSMDILQGIGLDREDYELAIRFTKDFYDENKEFITRLIQLYGRPALVEMWNQRFFYFVMKWEFNFVDNLGKASALSTDQIDVENAKRYGITYVDEKGEKKYPIILHNSPSGAIERCMYALLEKAYRMKQEGKVPTLPLWLSPTQVRLIPVSNKYMSKVEELAERIKAAQIRVTIDDREETVEKRIRDAEREWIRYTIVIGEKELNAIKLPVRDRVSRSIRALTIDELISEVREQVKGKPFIDVPKLISKKPLFISS
ncbi:MAG: threonine--tRNA ligase [Nitrososphaerota archaeon]|nr:threonine--tRNA ligase [Nitrososphaerales archaeon]MDW8044850.1 threonine--tRNA ligase [Nitrososphaerota archaeon]